MKSTPVAAACPDGTSEVPKGSCYDEYGNEISNNEGAATGNVCCPTEEKKEKGTDYFFNCEGSENALECFISESYKLSLVAIGRIAFFMLMICGIILNMTVGGIRIE
jgi:hypothetical protein